jgi:hypothetical protein
VLSVSYLRRVRRFVEDGGTTAANSAAYIDDWPAFIAFITDH